MVDELELLKKDWQKKGEELPKLSYDEIYEMIWKRSSSIVKWIFYISVIEFLAPHLLYLLPSANSGHNIFDSLGMNNAIIVVSIIQYGLVFYFMCSFYKRYREISVLDNAKQLTTNILKTRKTVKHYVFCMLSMTFLIFVMLAVGIYFNDNFMEALALGETFTNMSHESAKWAIIGVFIVFGIVACLVFGGIYFLLYGLLTRKLRTNYRELQKLEV